MHHIMLAKRPPSVQARGANRRAFKRELQAEGRRQGWLGERLAGKLYARIVWIHPNDSANRADLDNIVKAVLDAFSDDAETGELRLFDDEQFVHVWVSRHSPADTVQILGRPGQLADRGRELRDFVARHGRGDILYVEFGAASTEDVMLGPPFGVAP